MPSDNSSTKLSQPCDSPEDNETRIRKVTNGLEETEFYPEFYNLDTKQWSGIWSLKSLSFFLPSVFSNLEDAKERIDIWIKANNNYVLRQQLTIEIIKYP